MKLTMNPTNQKYTVVDVGRQACWTFVTDSE